MPHGCTLSLQSLYLNRRFMCHVGRLMSHKHTHGHKRTHPARTSSSSRCLSSGLARCPMRSRKSSVSSTHFTPIVCITHTQSSVKW